MSIKDLWFSNSVRSIFDNLVDFGLLKELKRNHPSNDISFGYRTCL